MAWYFSSPVVDSIWVFRVEVAAQRSALAAPPNGHSGSATAYKRKYVRNTAVGGVGYRRCWAGAWQVTGVRRA